MRPPDHIIVIGSGIGGMTAAIVLSELGHRVTVVEKNKLPGGLMRSYARKGMDCEVGVHYVGAMDDGQPLRQIFDLLGISGRIPFFRLGDGGVVDRYILPDMTFDFPPGVDLFEENLHRAFPEENRQIAGVIATIRSTIQRFSLSSILFGEKTEFNLSTELQPLESYFDKLGCSQKLRGILSVPLAWIGVGPEECPLYLWSSSISSYLMSSWKPVHPGAHMADTLAARLRELGGELICDDPVLKIRVRDHVVQGVVLKSGKTLDSPVVIAAVHPKIMIRMLPEDSYKPAFKNRIASLEETPGIFAAHIAVPDDKVSYRPYNTFVLDDAHALHGGVTFFTMNKSAKQGWNVVSVLEESPFEKWMGWENTTKDHRTRDYRETKEHEANILLDKAANVLGSMPGAYVVDSFTPLSFRDWMDSPRGGAYGVCRSVSQKFKTAALHRTPIEGLHLVGQSVFAPGILGTALGTLRVLAPLIGHDTLHQKFIDAGIKGI